MRAFLWCTARKSSLTSRKGRRSELLVWHQIAPLSLRQLTKRNLTHPNPLQADHLKADQFAHAADLMLLAFAQDESQLFAVLPADFGGPKENVVERQTVPELRQQFRREVLIDVRRAFAVGHAHQVLLFDRRVDADQILRDAAVLRQHQKAGRIDVETSGRR